MPTNKDFKHLVRARMKKTGESYTAARAQFLRSPSPAPASVASPLPDYAKLAGLSDAALERATGCTWEKWVFALDHMGAGDWSHRAIAEHVQTTYKVADWWAQTVTVGYERIKGLRAIGQRRGGGFEANKSKTLAAPAATVFRAIADARKRRVWLPDVKVTVRKATPNRSVRMMWDDGTPVEVWLTPKGARTTAQIQHRKLTDRDAADRRRAFWGERLSALAKSIEA